MLDDQLFEEYAKKPHQMIYWFLEYSQSRNYYTSPWNSLMSTLCPQLQDTTYATKIIEANLEI